MRRLRRWGPIVGVLATTALLAEACHTATEIKVHVTTNAVCAADGSHQVFKGLSISAGPPGTLSASTPTTTSSACGALSASDSATFRSGFGPNDLGSLVLLPAGDENAGVDVLVVATLDPPDKQGVSLDLCAKWVDTGVPAPGYRNVETAGSDPLMPCLYERRHLSFVKWSKLDLPIQIDSSCTGVHCDPGSTCYSGACVSATVAPTQCPAGVCRVGGAGGAAGGPQTSAGPTSTVDTTVASSTATASVATTSSGGCPGCACATPGDVCDPTASCQCACDTTLCVSPCTCSPTVMPAGGLAGTTCVCPNATSSSSASSSTGNSGSSSSASASASASTSAAATSSASSTNASASAAQSAAASGSGSSSGSVWPTSGSTGSSMCGTCVCNNGLQCDSVSCLCVCGSGCASTTCANFWESGACTSTTTCSCECNATKCNQYCFMMTGGVKHGACSGTPSTCTCM